MDLALNNLQRLICHKTKQTKPNQTRLFSVICRIFVVGRGSYFSAEMQLVYFITSANWAVSKSKILNIYVYERERERERERLGNLDSRRIIEKFCCSCKMCYSSSEKKN